MSNDTSASPSFPEPPGHDAPFPPPAPYVPPHLNYSLGCRPFKSASLAAACTHVHNNPLCLRGDVDYLSFYYCDGTRDASAAGAFAAAPHWLKPLLLVVWTAVLFAAIAAVADRFFAPAVERIARKLRLPEDVAGATLLALGGAAPDIFTQAAAIAESATPDARLAISESVGAGLFVATAGKALAVLVGLGAEARRGEAIVARRARGGTRKTPTENVVEVDAFPYVRDAMAYGGLIAVTATSVADGEISTFEALVFVAWYAAYVWVVLRGESVWRRARGLRSRADAGVPGGGRARVVGAGRDVEMTRDANASAAPLRGGGPRVSSSSKTSRNFEKSSSHAAAPFQGVFDSAADLRDLAEENLGALDENLERERLVGAGNTQEKPASSSFWSGESILERVSFRRGGGTRGGSNLSRGARARAALARETDYSYKVFGAIASLRRWAVTHGGLGRDHDEDDVASSDDDSDDSVPTEGFSHGLQSDPHSRGWGSRPSADWLAYASAPILLLMSLTMVSTHAPGRAARAHLATALTLGFAFAATVTGARAGFDAAAGRGASITVFVLWTAGAWFSVYAYAPRAGVNPRASPAVWACTFAVGILWMHACADELVGVFQAAGRIAGVRESLLGATVMAWGASAGDLGGMLAMARAGYVKMAVTAALAGPLCQLAMGSGLSMVIVRLRGVAIDSELAPNTVFLLWFGAAFVLAYYGFVVPYAHRCAFGRAGAWTVAGAYAAACAVFVVWGIASGGED